MDKEEKKYADRIIARLDAVIAELKRLQPKKATLGEKLWDVLSKVGVVAGIIATILAFIPLL